MQFFFSIIIPVYNTEEYLPRCLDSVVSQSFGTDRVQVIVVNDGSPKTKECEKIIESYKEKLHITYLKLQENKGTHIARKKGVESVTGEYFLFVDTDDYLEKKALKTLYDDIQKNGEADYIEFNFFLLRRGLFKVKNSFLLPRDSMLNIIDVVDMKAQKGEHYWNVWNKCFLTSFASPIYAQMPEDYIVFSEDFYQICILDHFAKNRRVLQKYLYVHIVGIGVTEIKTYTKDKLKKRVLSGFNIEKNLTAFYQTHKPKAIEAVREAILDSYLHMIERVGIETFVECCREIIDDEALENILLQHLVRTSEREKEVKKQKSFATIFVKIRRYLKRRFRR